MSSKLVLIAPKAKKTTNTPGFMIMVHGEVILEYLSRLTADRTLVSMLCYQIIADHIDLFGSVHVAEFTERITLCQCDSLR